jgi:hypothetical protein
MSQPQFGGARRHVSTARKGKRLGKKLGKRQGIKNLTDAEAEAIIDKNHIAFWRGVTIER